MNPPEKSAFETRLRNLQRPAQVYVLLDGQETLQQFRSLTKQLVAAGVHVLQLRDKRLTDRQLVERARLMCELTRGTPTQSIINDRPDVTVLADADGVHVGQDELTVADARAVIGPNRLVGVSTHSIEQARQAVQDGADYLGCGPTFRSQTKSFEQFPGLAFLKEGLAEIQRPAFAIGGIDAENLGQLLAIGWTRIAVSSAVIRAPDPAAAARSLITRLSAATLSDWKTSGGQECPSDGGEMRG